MTRATQTETGEEPPIDSTDAPLRRDIRLLGDVLGRILVEQEGQALLDEGSAPVTWPGTRAGASSARSARSSSDRR